MKGIIKAGLLISTVALMSACSTMKEIEVRETKAHPTWYEECAHVVWVKADLNKQVNHKHMHLQ